MGKWMMILAAVMTISAAEVSDAVLTNKVAWTYGNAQYELAVQVNEVDYQYYKSKPRGYTYTRYTQESYGHEVLPAVAKQLWSLGASYGLSEWERVNVIAAFVQQLNYEKETGKGTVEYIKYPAETLMEGGGDCEDSAILLAALLKTLGFNAVLISPKGHMAVGIACDNCQGTYITYENQKYYYLETTYPGWSIGEMPEEFAAKACTVFPVLTTRDASLRHGPGYVSQDSYVPVVATTQPSVAPTPSKPKQQQKIEYTSDKGVVMTAKKTLVVNGQTITAYTQGDGDVQVVEEGGKVKVYSSGPSLLVLE